jgi:hypothetical protein
MSTSGLYQETREPREDLPDDEVVEEHADRGEVLFHRGWRDLVLEALDVGTTRIAWSWWRERARFWHPARKRETAMA